MTKKTRLRVARIAAGAVIAAGASLTAAGAASAVGLDVDIVGVKASASADDKGVTVGAGVGTEDPTEDPTSIPSGDPSTTPPTTNPPTDNPTTQPPTTNPPTTNPPTEDPTKPPTGDPTKPPTGKPTDKPTGKPTAEPSSSSGTGGGGSEDPNTCTVELDGTACQDNTDTDSAGSKPVEQSKAKEELAETGASETTFLLVGAATMIAGGIGFRLMPRLVNRNTVA
ncbi:hypothetical protein ABZ547_42020 [Streptomyces sparsogenes]|uniref:hypothetical protein n=1 Tax=Streptomyces sparsogenes TaxID=67365 RepID=UPI0033D23515